MNENNNVNNLIEAPAPASAPAPAPVTRENLEKILNTQLNPIRDAINGLTNIFDDYRRHSTLISNHITQLDRLNREMRQYITMQAERANIDTRQINLILERSLEIRDQLTRMSENFINIREFTRILNEILDNLDLDNTINNFMKIKGEYSELITQILNQNDESQRKIRDLESKLKQEREKYPILDGRIESLQQEFNSVKAENNKLRKKIQKLKQKLTICLLKRKVYEKDIKQYKTQITDLDKRIENLEKDIKLKDEEYDVLHKKYCENKKELEQLQKEKEKIDSLRLEIEKLKKQTNKDENKIKNLEKQLEIQEKAHIKDLKEKLNDQKIQNEKKLSELKLENLKLKNGQKKLIQLISDLKKKLNDLQNSKKEELQKKQEEIEELKNKLEESENDINNININLQNNEKLINENEDLKKKLEIANKKIQETNSLNDKHQHAINALKEINQTNKLEISFLKEQAKNLEEHHKIEIEELQDEINKLKIKSTKEIGKYNKLKKEKTDMEAIIKQLSKDNKKFSTENDKLKNINKNLNKTIEILEQENQKLNIQIETLINKNEKLEKELAEVMEKLKKKTKRERPKDVQKFLNDISYQMSRYIETKSWRGTASIERRRNQVVQEMKNIQTAFTKKFGIKTNQRQIQPWTGGTTTIRPCPKINSDDQDFQNSNDDVSKIISIIPEVIDTDKNKKDLEKLRDIISNLPLPNTDDIEQNIREKLKLNNDKIKQNEKDNPYIADIGPQTKEDEEDVEDVEDVEDEEEEENDNEENDNKEFKTVDLNSENMIDDQVNKINKGLKKIRNYYAITRDITNLLENKGDIQSSLKRNEPQNGGHKSLVGQELYDKIIFTKGGIKKINLKKNRHKKKVNKIVDNLIKILYKSKGGNGDKEDKQDKNLMVSSIASKYTVIDKNIKEYIVFFEKKLNKYNINKSNKEKKTDFKTYYFSVGEMANYERIMKTIIDHWSNLGLKDINDDIYRDIENVIGRISVIDNNDNDNVKDKYKKKHTLFEFEMMPEQPPVQTGNKSLIYFRDSGFKIVENFEIENLSVDHRKKLNYMDHKMTEFINNLQHLYDNYYLMIRRYYNLFLKLREKTKEIKPIDSFIIIRDETNTTLQTELLNFLIILRNELDNFLVLTRKPVSVYARINDIGRFSKRLKKNDDNDDIVQDFDVAKKICNEKTNTNKITKEESNNIFAAYPKNVEKFDTNLCKYIKSDDFIQWSEGEGTKNRGYLNIDKGVCEYSGTDMGTMVRNSRSVKFSEIFFKPEFNSNETISQYMLLDKLITRGIGTYLVTYGYSGVGKSYTLFGTKKSDGLLQATIKNVGNKSDLKSIQLRIYELYGLGIGYSECWNNYNKIDQSIFHYSMKKNERDNELMVHSVDEKRGKEIPIYINSKIDLNTEKLSKFSVLVSDIENIRKRAKRIKTTINNPVSSRGKIIYDFMFEFTDGRKTPFIIDDSPGAENLLETYIYNNTKINKKTKEAINKYVTKKIDIKEKTASWEFAMFCAGLVQPLWLGFLNANGVILGYNKLINSTEDGITKQRINNYVAFMSIRLDGKLNKLNKLNKDGSISLEPQPIKNDQDYCQQMYGEYEGKVIMDYINKFVQKNVDKESYKNSILNKTKSFYAKGIKSEKENMNLAFKLIYETIKYCKDIEGEVDTNLKKGENKYDLFIYLLINIFELSNIFLKIKEADMSEQIDGNADNFATSWTNIESDIKNASYDTFYKKWVEFFNKKVGKKTNVTRQYTSDSGSEYKDKHWSTWSNVLNTLQLMKKENKGDKEKSNLSILLAGEQTWRSNVSVVDEIFTTKKQKKLKKNKLKKFLDKLAKTLPKGTEDINKKDFIELLINGELVNSKLIRNWESELKEVVNTIESTKIDYDVVKKTREYIGNYITLAMESWYINQNISGILKKFSEASRISQNDIETQIVKYRDDTSSSMESNRELIEKYINDYSNMALKRNDYSNMALKRTNNFIKYCEDSYKPDDLFRVEEFPETITKVNQQANEKLSEKEIDEKEWANIKIDTIVGSVMQPYFDKTRTYAIKDFKMFYVLQNNNTKLKCYDQLKTFHTFTNFIKKVY
jgi:hypothetical protein